MPDIVRQYFDFLTARGLSPIAAAGVLGNIEQESGFNPSAFNAKEGAEGLGQWRLDRRDAMRAHVARSDLPPALAQLDFMVKEMGPLRDRLNKARAPEDAAMLFGKEYERPKVVEPTRATNARNLYAGLADPTYQGAKRMVAENGTRDTSALPPGAVRLSDLQKKVDSGGQELPPGAVRLSDLQKKSGDQQAKQPTSVPDPQASQEAGGYVTGGTMEDGLNLPTPPFNPMQQMQDDAVKRRADLRDLQRGAVSMFGVDAIVAGGRAALDKIKGDERPFSEIYKGNLAAEHAKTQEAVARPGAGGVDLPFGLGRINANPYTAGNILGAYALGKVLPTGGAERLPVVGGMASGLVQGSTLAALDLLGQSMSNTIAGDGPMPTDLRGPMMSVAGGVAGGAVGDLIGGGITAVQRLRTRTPEFRSSPGRKAEKQMLNVAQTNARGDPRGSAGVLDDMATRIENGQSRPGEMLADRSPFLEQTYGNASNNPTAPADTVVRQRLAERAARMESVPRANLERIFNGDMASVMDDLRATTRDQARSYYDRAGIPHYDPAMSIADNAAVFARAPTVPDSTALRELRTNVQFQRMSQHVRENPIFAKLPDDNIAFLDQVYKLFNDGVDPSTGNPSRAYARTSRVLQSEVSKAIAPTPDFEPGQAYMRAVENFATNRGIEEAATLGKRVRTWSDDDRARIGRMSPEERQALQMGAADKLRVDLEGLTPRQTQTLFGKGALRRNLESALGPEDAAAFIDDMVSMREQLRLPASFSGSNTREKFASGDMAASTHTPLPMSKIGAINYGVRKLLNKMTPPPTTGPTPFNYADIANDLLTRTDPAQNARVLRDLIGAGQARAATEETRRIMSLLGASLMGNR